MRTLMLTAATLAALTLGACGTGETPADETAATPAATATEAAGATPAAAAAATPGASAVLDANTATAAQLGGISGMTPALAEAVVAGRPYASASAFNAKLTETLSPAQAASVREQVFVPINLNTATEADIKLIPGMTDKMVHEFLEYRPYADMAEFDREIGKYVDEAEVARLRRYVTL